MLSVVVVVVDRPKRLSLAKLERPRLNSFAVADFP